MIVHRTLRVLVRWIDRFVPPELLDNRTEALRSRAVVGASLFATAASLTAQSIRLRYETQHWIPLLSWAICTFMFAIGPLVMRSVGQLWLSSSLVSVAMLIGSLGVAAKEGGVSSPNAMVMIIAPVVGTLLGGWRGGLTVALLALLSTLSMWAAHAAGLLSSIPGMELWTLTTMRATMLGALTTTVFLLTLLYEIERDRAEVELTDKARELAAARDAVMEAAETKFELLAAQRRELERDLELTAAVQKLLLPKHDSFETDHVLIAGFSVTAAQAGGDWWFTETLRDGTLRVLLGDVTGHGAAPAMVAALVAGAFLALQETGSLEGKEVLQVLHAVSLNVSAGKYTMPFGLLEVSPYGRATWLSAAAPPLLVLRTGGEVDSITVPGTALGSSTYRVGERCFDLAPGERVLLASDGVSELRMSSGKELGLRRLSKLLRGTEKIPLSDARDALAEELDRLRGNEILRDDVTFCLCELKYARPQRSLA